MISRGKNPLNILKDVFRMCMDTRVLPGSEIKLPNIVTPLQTRPVIVSVVGGQVRRQSMICTG